MCPHTALPRAANAKSVRKSSSLPRTILSKICCLKTGAHERQTSEPDDKARLSERLMRKYGSVFSRACVDVEMRMSMMRLQISIGKSAAVARRRRRELNSDLSRRCVVDDGGRELMETEVACGIGSHVPCVLLDRNEVCGAVAGTVKVIVRSIRVTLYRSETSGKQ